MKIAVTGGIGSGKSSVCNIFAKKGYSIISADKIAKELLANDKEIRKAVVAEFGEAAYDNGKPNNKYLAEKVFSNQQNVVKINSIIHPHTIIKIDLLITEALKKSDIVFVESALIFEADRKDYFDHIILVLSSDENKIKRVTKRDGSSIDDVVKRIENQIPDDKKKSHSDFIIENNGTIEQLNQRSLFVLSILESMNR